MIGQTNNLDLLVRAYNEQISPSVFFSADAIKSLIGSGIDCRVWLCRSLVYCESVALAVPLLCQLAQDVEDCVRVEAVDTLSAFCCEESFSALCYAISDADELVRAYAAFGIGIIGRKVDKTKARQLLTKMEQTETCHRVLVSVHEGLYLLGVSGSLRKLFELFISDDYLVKCAVLHAIAELINNQNWDTVKTFSDSIDMSTQPTAVADAARQLQLQLKTFC